MRCDAEKRPSPDKMYSAKSRDEEASVQVPTFFADLKKALTFIIDVFLATALRAMLIVVPEEVLSPDPLRVCWRPRMGGESDEMGGEGTNEFSRKSLRTTSGSRAELCGHLRAGMGGDRLRGAGRRRALPFGFAPVGDGQEPTLLMGDAGLGGNAMSTYSDLRMRLGWERTDMPGLCNDIGETALPRVVRSSYNPPRSTTSRTSRPESWVEIVDTLPLLTSAAASADAFLSSLNSTHSSTPTHSSPPKR